MVLIINSNNKEYRAQGGEKIEAPANSEHGKKRYIIPKPTAPRRAYKNT